MARYFFDVYNSQFTTIDEHGIECADRDEVGSEALQLLCVIARDNPLIHLHNQLTAVVRDEGGKVVLTATAGLSVTWIERP